MSTPRIAVGLALAALLTGIAATPAMAADLPPVVDPNCNATVTTPTLFDQDSLADTVPMTVQAPFECGSAFDTNAWSFTWRSEAGDSFVWKPGGYSFIRNTTFQVPVPNLYPGVWTLTSNVTWLKVKSAPITILGTVHDTATVTRSGVGFTVTGTIDRLAKGGRVPYTSPVLLSQLASAGYINRATIPVDTGGHYAYTSTSREGLTLRLSTGRNLQSPYVEFATSNVLTLAPYTPPAPPVTPAPPAPSAPPVVTAPPVTAPPVTAPPVAPAPPVTTDPTPPTTPAPPTAHAKHRTYLSVSGVTRHGSRLSMRATLIDKDVARSLSAVITVQRWTSHGWKTVAVETTGRFTVKAAKGLYRLHYAGTPSYAPSSSKGFLK